MEVPTIQAVPLEEHSQLDAALTRLDCFGWVIFASANAVEAVFSRLAHREGGRDARAFGGVQIGAIGPATAEALERRGIFADFVAVISASEAVVQELSGRDWDSVPVLLPGADIGRDQPLSQPLAGKST